MDNRGKRLLASRYEELYYQFLAFRGENFVIKNVICSSAHTPHDEDPQ